MIQVYVSKGYNTDGKTWSKPAKADGLEGIEMDDSTTLYDAVVECRVIKTPEEIALMQHVNDLSSEAHFEVRVVPKASDRVFLYHAFVFVLLAVCFIFSIFLLVISFPCLS